MVKSFIIFAFIVCIFLLAILATKLGILQVVMRSDEEGQQQMVAGRSEESMTAIIEENLKARISWSADKTADQLWIAAH
ncbi:MAG: hypothetical protein IK054_07975, partial [Lachnospiraceae bacterium]|nr:hypothetical protein [Lachnospiraceae bacterium]